MTPAGDPRIPYDQTDPLQQMGAPAQAGGPTGAAMPGAALPPGAPDIGASTAPTFGLDQMGGGGLGAPDAGGLANLFPGDAQGGLGTDPGAGVPGSTDDLTGNDLAALSQPVGDLQSPEDQQVAAMDAALDDPTTPPEVKQQLMQQLDLAARRRLAGLGGQPQGGGM